MWDGIYADFRDESNWHRTALISSEPLPAPAESSPAVADLPGAPRVESGEAPVARAFPCCRGPHHPALYLPFRRWMIVVGAVGAVDFRDGNQDLLAGTTVGFEGVTPGRPSSPGGFGRDGPPPSSPRPQVSGPQSPALQGRPAKAQGRGDPGNHCSERRFASCNSSASMSAPELGRPPQPSTRGCQRLTYASTWEGHQKLCRHLISSGPADRGCPWRRRGFTASTRP